MNIQTHPSSAQRLSILTTGIAVLITFVLLVAYQFISERREQIDELHTEASIIGANSSAALVFNDKKSAKEILATARFTPRIIGAALYHLDGTLFVLENDPGGVFPQRIDVRSLDRRGIIDAKLGFFSELIREDVYQDETPVGSLVLHVTYTGLYWRLLEYSISILFIGMIALFFTHRFTIGIRRKMALTEGQLQRMALYDQVTGLPNRTFFEFELGKAVALSKREEKCGALLFIDVDDFKKVNDLCGHHAGDQVLMMIAERLKKTLRASDFVARLGGDEFAVVLGDCKSPENAATVTNHMIAAMVEPFPTEPMQSHVGLSIGLTIFPNDSDDPETLLRWSDMAMYVAKSRGKNCYQFFSEEINHNVHNKLRLEAALRKALNESDSGLWVAYQPQVDARTRKLIGVEALMRWQLADGGFVPPGEFIPIAEKTGLIIDLGVWLLRRICRDLAEMRSQGIEIPKVAVNVSPRELTRGTAIVDGICRTLGEFSESISRFQFELTENALMDEHGSAVLDAFREAGFTLAIDDFGSGYSSLGYLKRFHVGALKIDRQFIDLLPGDAENAAIVSAIIQMSETLGISVVAEGVETEAQAEFLAAHGCNILQGYLICRPIPPQDLVAYIKDRATR